jgi:hypothetical protein
VVEYKSRTSSIRFSDRLLIVDLPQVTIEVEFFGESFCAVGESEQEKNGKLVRIPYGALECGLLIVACYMNIEVLLSFEIGVTKECISWP